LLGKEGPKFKPKYHQNKNDIWHVEFPLHFVKFPVLYWNCGSSSLYVHCEKNNDLMEKRIKMIGSACSLINLDSLLNSTTSLKKNWHQCSSTYSAKYKGNEHFQIHPMKQVLLKMVKETHKRKLCGNFLDEDRCKNPQQYTWKLNSRAYTMIKLVVFEGWKDDSTHTNW
jgi:hypothetical protein